MRTLFLLRHSLTEATERRQYCGSSDLPLSPKGLALAENCKARRPLPRCDLYLSSGMRRATETLECLYERAPDGVIGEFREMDFGEFELKSHDQLSEDPCYQDWISDASGEIRCPGGESRSAFLERTRRGADRLLSMRWDTACVVCHGGVIVRLMKRWFPEASRNFYEWQPMPCDGYVVFFEGRRPVGFENI